MFGELTFKAEVEVRHEASREHHGLSEEDNLGVCMSLGLLILDLELELLDG